ncbi:hypothetical protein HYC85_009528 [Camellia sinensis]|uniref:B box-type domain-containing protein n=1 Tax=Camellia sinensis TaxID=4442 RepID=A0A7J7HHX6_CAMSI|nr:hypothetical protein HYC85_009528 [Camellia sinensis]
MVVKIAIQIVGSYDPMTQYTAFDLTRTLDRLQHTMSASATQIKIPCDVCNKDKASVFCSADEAALYTACDHRVHHANKLAGKNQCFSLLHPSPKQFPLCDICQEKRAFLFCQQERAILCRDYDIPIRKASEHTRNHYRFLLTGVKLSATSSLYSLQSSSDSSTANNDLLPNLKSQNSIAATTTNNKPSSLQPTIAVPAGTIVVIGRQYLEAFEDLLLEARVLPLGVLPYLNNINILVASRQTRQIEAIDKGSITIELFPELNVERTHTTTDWSLEPPFQGDLVLADRLDHLRRHALHVAMDIVALKEDWGVYCFHDREVRFRRRG